MPFKDPEKQKAYLRKYYEDHKEELRGTRNDYLREYHAANREKEKAYQRKYHEEHLEYFRAVRENSKE